MSRDELPMWFGGEKMLCQCNVSQIQSHVKDVFVLDAVKPSSSLAAHDLECNHAMFVFYCRTRSHNSTR